MLRQLTIVVGKGGVGRSTVAAALARNAAAAGGRVLAVDSVSDGGLRAALAEPHDDPAPEIGERGSIELLELTTERALDEYLKLFLRVPIPPSRIRPIARIFDYVATAAPGVREILAIGKIAWEVREGAWDAVIVDGPATGHVIELLAAPKTLGDLISVGPLSEQTEWIAALLADPEITGAVVATTAESLPVSECFELMERFVDETDVDLMGLVVTRLPDLLDDDGLSEADELARLGLKSSQSAPLSGALGAAAGVVALRARAAAIEIDRLASVDLPYVWVPEAAEPVDATRRALLELNL